MLTITGCKFLCICLIKIETADGQTDKRTDGNGRPISLYSRDHVRSIKHKIRESTNGLDYNSSFAREVKIRQKGKQKKATNKLKEAMKKRQKKDH